MRKALVILVATALLGILATYTFPAGSTVPVSSKTSTISSTVGAPTPSASIYKNGTFTGTLASGNYEDIQVVITIRGGKVIDVATPQENTYGSSRSQSIDGYAIPQLKQEVLNKQSAVIDSISGATYTTQTYIQSLQSAIDQARV